MSLIDLSSSVLSAVLPDGTDDADETDDAGGMLPQEIAQEITQEISRGISQGEIGGEIRLEPAGAGARSGELRLEADEADGADAVQGEQTMGGGLYP